MIRVIAIIITIVTLVSCGKPSNRSDASGPCANAKGSPGLETDVQAQQACRDNKKFLGPDAKPSNTKIENN
jgi:hypothetical protein